MSEKSAVTRSIASHRGKPVLRSGGFVQFSLSNRHFEIEEELLEGRVVVVVITDGKVVWHFA